MNIFDHLLKALSNGGGERYWAEVIQAKGFGLFGDKDNGGNVGATD